MPEPRLARSLVVLRGQVDALAPKRDRTSDGWIGNKAHKATKSDHNPNADGVVTALDVDHDPAHGCDGQAIADALVASRDARISYLIFNRRIISSTVSPWVWRPYGGSNPHTAHLHVSVHDPALYDNAKAWAMPGSQPAADGREPPTPVVQHPADQLPPVDEPAVVRRGWLARMLAFLGLTN